MINTVPKFKIDSSTLQLVDMARPRSIPMYLLIHGRAAAR